MNKILIFVLMLLVFAIPAFANVDVYNVGTVIDLKRQTLSSYANACAVYETADQVTYVFKATWVDSSDQLHSKPFYIGDLNANDAYVTVITNAASDVNPIYHFSYDNCNTWVTTTPAGLDATSNTAKLDTIGIEVGVDDAKFHVGVWLVIEFADGSTALNDAEYCTMVISFKKDGTYMTGAVQPTIQRVRNTSVTNP